LPSEQTSRRWESQRSSMARRKEAGPQMRHVAIASSSTVGD
jgi:hypothetical protein